MSAETIMYLVTVAAVAFVIGSLWGAVMQDWNWRVSADSHHNSHKSRGRWFKVFPSETFYIRYREKSLP